MTKSKLDLQNTEIAFKHLSDGDLYKAWTLFRAINIKSLVLAGPPLISGALKLHLPIKFLLRATVFKQFCGGETLEECVATMKLLRSGGVYSILDYGVEGEKTEAGFDSATDEVLRVISSTKLNKSVPFCVFKLTALARFELLEQVSQMGTRKITTALAPEWARVTDRVTRICNAAVEAGKLVMIDAEESWIQPAIDSLAHMMMRQHNKSQARIYTTIQMYQTEGLAQVKSLLETSNAEGWIPAIKLVRGAYMEKERARAKAFGYENPIHPDKPATDEAYDSALRLILAPDSRAHLCAGTHNADSTVLVTKLMGKSELSPSSAKVWFAQLLGMSDDLTFNTAHAGYNAAKYVPYGPIAAVLPYLFRRAQENTSIAGQSGRELKLIERELRRRNRI